MTSVRRLRGSTLMLSFGNLNADTQSLVKIVLQMSTEICHILVGTFSIYSLPLPSLHSLKKNLLATASTGFRIWSLEDIIIILPSADKFIFVALVFVARFWRLAQKGAIKLKLWKEDCIRECFVNFNTSKYIIRNLEFENKKKEQY